MNKKRILIVDDEQTNIALIKSVFSEELHDIKIAHDGEEGLNLAREEVPDLILLDVMMPKLDGFKVCGLLKADKRYAQIPIIILSSRAGADDIEISKSVGADFYMLKPIDKKKLSEAVEPFLN